MHLKPMIVFFVLINSVVPLCTMENSVDEKTEEEQSNLKKSIYTFHTSMLPLQPGLPRRFVDLGYPYASITQTEKERSIYLQESNYTFFKHQTDGNKCVIIGPLEPCFMLVLNFSMLRKTFVAHVGPNSDLTSFLIKVLEYIYSNTDPAKYIISEDQVTGELFTNECRDFNKKMFPSADFKEFFSYADIAGYKDQPSWLKRSRKLICNALGLRKDAIQLRMFPVEKQLEPKYLGCFQRQKVTLKLLFVRIIKQLSIVLA